MREREETERSKGKSEEPETGRLTGQGTERRRENPNEKASEEEHRKNIF